MSTKLRKLIGNTIRNLQEKYKDEKPARNPEHISIEIKCATGTIISAETIEQYLK